MRAQQVNKLYSKLTPHEQAALAFEAAAQTKGEECDLIINSVEQRTYDAPHIDYQTRMQGLMQFSLSYGIFFWKRLCQIGSAPALEADGVHVDVQPIMDDFASMNVAFENICDKLKVDPVVVRKFAECGCYQPLSDAEVKDHLVEKYTDLFTKISYLDK